MKMTMTSASVAIIRFPAVILLAILSLLTLKCSNSSSMMFVKAFSKTPISYRHVVVRSSIAKLSYGSSAAAAAAIHSPSSSTTITFASTTATAKLMMSLPAVSVPLFTKTTPSSSSATTTATLTSLRMVSNDGEQRSDVSIVETCRRKIADALETQDVKVIGAYDDPNGSHIAIEVTSALFEGKRPVQRQQLVYKALWEELQGPVHAVDSMICKTPDEKK